MVNLYQHRDYGLFREGRIGESYLFSSSDFRRSLARFWPALPSVFISLIMNVSFLLSNWLKIYKMRFISQVNKDFPFCLFLSNLRIGHFGDVFVGKDAQNWWTWNVDIIQLWTLNSIYFLWNPLRISNLIWCCIIIFFIHSVTQWRPMNLTVIF